MQADLIGIDAPPIAIHFRTLSMNYHYAQNRNDS